MESLATLVAAAFFFLSAAVFLRRRIIMFCAGRASAPAPVIPQQRLITISDATITQRALVDNADVFSNRPSALFGKRLVTGYRRRRSDNIISAPHGRFWRALRCNLSSQVIHATRIASFGPLRRAAVDTVVTDLRQSAAKGKVVIMVRDCLYAAVFSMVARLCFGAVDEVQVRAMQRVIQGFVQAVGETLSSNKQPELGKLVRWSWSGRDYVSFRQRQAELFLPLIEARRHSSPNCNEDGEVRSYIDSLLDLRVPNVEFDDQLDDDEDMIRRPLTDDQLVSLVSEFLGAGTETVVASIEWTLAHLVTKPQIQNKLRREVIANCDGKCPSPSEERDIQMFHRSVMPYLHAVVLESLRMHPAVPFAIREVRTEAGVVIGRTTMPDGGLRVHFSLGAIGRDSKTWPDPDEFRPERFLAGGEEEDVGPLPGPKEIKMMPFGAGPRYCPGMGLAMLNVKCFMAALVRDFEWADESSVDLTELDGFFKVMKKPLRAHVTPRASFLKH
ncbi:cytochrome P450 89A2-like [Lolium rigidum]|uniref:cytochrome P450 89A2-like n=1 Tax=Lolium rigidum TaxID=89674 RepID=UPI001F5DCCBA|nr:cytochrome P450 89A2-like [Lolium rigidum]